MSQVRVVIGLQAGNCLLLLKVRRRQIIAGLVNVFNVAIVGSCQLRLKKALDMQSCIMRCRHHQIN